METECDVCHRVQFAVGGKQPHNHDKRGPGGAYFCVLRDCPNVGSKIHNSLEEHFKKEHDASQILAAGIVTHYYFPMHRNGKHTNEDGVRELLVRPGVRPRVAFAGPIAHVPYLGVYGSRNPFCYCRFIPGPCLSHMYNPAKKRRIGDTDAPIVAPPPLAKKPRRDLLESVAADDDLPPELFDSEDALSQ